MFRLRQRDADAPAAILLTGLGAANGLYPLALGRLEPEAILKATILSFSGNEKPLAKVVRQLIE